MVYVKAERQPKSQFLAIVLCLFLGLVGIHDFYLGKNGAGVIKLLIAIFLGWCVVGLIINGIWCIGDFLMILSKTDDCFYTKEELEQQASQKQKNYIARKEEIIAENRKRFGLED